MTASSSQSFPSLPDAVGQEVSMELACDEEEELAGDETYLLRNPSKQAQPIWKRKHVKKTDAEKEVAKMKKARREEIQGAYISEVTELQEFNKQRIKDIAAKYEKPELQTQNTLFYSSGIKNKRKPSLFHAEVHEKRLILNSNKAVGERYSLTELQDQVRDEVKMREKDKVELPEEEKQRLLDQLLRDRELKETGARVNNKSAMRDVYHVTKWVHSESTKLSVRTGALVTMTLGRGHMNDTYAPSSFETENCKGFFKQSLGYNPTEVMARLECFGSSFKQGQMSVQNREGLRKDCAGMIGEGLQSITGIQSISMNYKSYKKIVARYRVNIVGWPANIPFVNPSQLAVEDLRRLRDALMSKTCKWQQLSAGDLATFLAEVDGGEIDTLGPKRKERSDKGKKRKVSGNDIPENRKKRAKKAASQLPPYISPDFVNSDSEGDTSDLDNGPELHTNLRPFTPTQLRAFSADPDTMGSRTNIAPVDNTTTTTLHHDLETTPITSPLSDTSSTSAADPPTTSIPTESLSTASTSMDTTNTTTETSVATQTSTSTTNDIMGCTPACDQAPDDIIPPTSAPNEQLGLLTSSVSGKRMSTRINGRHVPVFSG